MKRIAVTAIVLMLVGFAHAQQQPDQRLPPPGEPLARFNGKVKWIEVMGRREAKAVPIGTHDLNWLVGIEIVSIEKPAKPFDKKGEQTLLIHSPSQLFHQPSDEETVGKDYSFKIFGDLKDGIPRYTWAEATEGKSGTRKKGL